MSGQPQEAAPARGTWKLERVLEEPLAGHLPYEAHLDPGDFARRDHINAMQLRDDRVCA